MNSVIKQRRYQNSPQFAWQYSGFELVGVEAHHVAVVGCRDNANVFGEALDILVFGFTEIAVAYHKMLRRGLQRYQRIEVVAQRDAAAGRERAI